MQLRADAIHDECRARAVTYALKPLGASSGQQPEELFLLFRASAPTVAWLRD